jgi:RES domain
MARRPGTVPPADFATRDLPIELVPDGATFVRIHRSGLDPLHFGSSGDNRFDDPQSRYGVCYAARSLAGAFAETCLRQVGATLVPLSRLAECSVTALMVTAELRLVELHGSGLARIGATAAASSGTYDISQDWSRAIRDHSANADGIVYRSNHDNGELCVALFDHCRDRLRPGLTIGLLQDRARFAGLLDRYKVGLG